MDNHKMSDRAESELDCPFCMEDDFDAIGLKHHLLQGHCEQFNKVEVIIATCQCDSIVPTYPMFRENRHVSPCPLAAKP